MIVIACYLIAQVEGSWPTLCYTVSCKHTVCRLGLNLNKDRKARVISDHKTVL